MEVRHLDGEPVIIGGGIAGLVCALKLTPTPVTILVEAPLGAQAASALAQGGLAVSLGADDDAERHLADTLAAGDGLCNSVIARRIVEAAPSATEWLIALGARFDTGSNGAPSLGREAAHSRCRIIHAAGDGTGREIMRALIEAVRRVPSIRVLEGVAARRLIVEDNVVAGVLAAGPAGPVMLPASRVVIATGGIGALYQQTSNPMGAFGQGLALAAQAGAVLADLEFVQFHPTALDVDARPMPLISEAVRGEGAILVNETGERFMADEAGAELATRDVVSRAVWAQLASGHRVFLDARAALGERFAARFPGITANCRRHGYDPATQLIPVRPAAHYHMGGIAVHADGRASLAGLWACGEAACTGLHGANRLASNSLMEAVVCAAWVAESIAGAPSTRVPVPRVTAMPPAPDPSAIRPILSGAAGVLRDGRTLREATQSLRRMAMSGGPATDTALVALMITVAAQRREESRGAHYRTDHPAQAASAVHSQLRRDEVLPEAPEIAIPFKPIAIEA